MKIYDNEFARVKAAASRGEDWAVEELRRMQKRATASKKAKNIRRARAAKARRAAFEKRNDERFKQTWYYDD